MNDRVRVRKRKKQAAGRGTQRTTSTRDEPVIVNSVSGLFVVILRPKSALKTVFGSPVSLRGGVGGWGGQVRLHAASRVVIMVGKTYLVPADDTTETGNVP